MKKSIKARGAITAESEVVNGSVTAQAFIVGKTTIMDGGMSTANGNITYPTQAGTILVDADVVALTNTEIDAICV